MKILEEYKEENSPLYFKALQNLARQFQGNEFLAEGLFEAIIEEEGEEAESERVGV